MMRQALAEHNALLRSAIGSNNGLVFKTMRNVFCAVFARAEDAAQAAE